jgi:outer membrane protein assembly factor BamD (BamD/ComL family)
LIKIGNGRTNAIHRTPTSRRAVWTSALTLFVLAPGCASLNPWKEDEYLRAKNAIEGYEDKEGNWVRPEGLRADRKQSSELPKVLQQIPGLGTRPVNKEEARTKYREADELFKQASAAPESERAKLYRNAAKKYLDAGKDWTSSALEQDAMYMAAESYFFAEDYTKAENHYVKLLKEYPRTRWQDKVDRRRMEIGHYWLQFPDKFYHVNLTDNKRPWNDTENHGKRVLEKMRLDSPTSQLADDVTLEIANTEFQRENWNEALDTYRDLISVYPDSPHQFDAHFLGAKAALMAYQGAQYTAEPLEHADKMLTQIVKQFPDHAQKQKDQIRELMAEVKFRKAERLYDEALYRANKEEYAAARIYCDRILADYEDTPFSEKARAIIDKGEGKPDVPTPYLYWMTTVFPSRDKIAPLIKAGQAQSAAANAQALANRQGSSSVRAASNTGSGNPSR